MLTTEQLKELQDRLGSANHGDFHFQITAKENGFTIQTGDRDQDELEVETYEFTYAPDVDGRKMVILEVESNKKGWLMEMVPSLIYAAIYFGDSF